MYVSFSAQHVVSGLVTIYRERSHWRFVECNKKKTRNHNFGHGGMGMRLQVCLNLATTDGNLHDIAYSFFPEQHNYFGHSMSLSALWSVGETEIFRGYLDFRGAPGFSDRNLRHLFYRPLCFLRIRILTRGPRDTGLEWVGGERRARVLPSYTPRISTYNYTLPVEWDASAFCLQRDGNGIFHKKIFN